METMKLSGIEEIDHQHKTLLYAFKRVKSKINNPKEQQKFLEFALYYAREHFTFEETLMEKYQYFDEEGHKQLHRDFLELIERAKEQKKLDAKVISYLETWLKFHIDTEAELFKELFSEDYNTSSSVLSMRAHNLYQN